MTISLQDAGKRFNREWIFRHLNFQFQSGRAYAITGINGSGKSTLLQIAGGMLMPSEGKVVWGNGSNDAQPENFFRHISFSAPYLDLPEELTAIEIIKFQSAFKSFSVADKELLAAVGLSTAASKQVRYFSSGMKQRLKLGLAFFSETAVLLLDEPLSNLDTAGADIYQNLLATRTRDRLLLISSNDPAEYVSCDEIIAIADFKPAMSDGLQ